MARMNGRSAAPAEPTNVETGRLARSVRRDALIDAAADLVASADVEAVSMEAVAERAGVSRPLVYKHFANRTELLTALYQRESALLHSELSASVSGAETLEDTFRALIRGALQAQASRGATFAALRDAGLRKPELRAEQRERDRMTLRYFASRAVREYNLERRQAKAAVAIVLGAIDTVLAQWRQNPTREYAGLLEDTYVSLAMGGLAQLAAKSSDNAGRPARAPRQPQRYPPARERGSD
jgi:AcrR family transcriptional regulator